MNLKENSLFIRKPSLAVSIAIYAAAFILMLSGVIFYDYADDVLAAQRADILDRTMEYAVQSISDELKNISALALNIRSGLRYVAMPETNELTNVTRLELHDASAQMEAMITSSDLLQSVYLYSNESGYGIFPTAVLEDRNIRTFYDLGGFAAEEMNGLHGIFSWGKLVASESGRQMAYLLSIGKDEQGTPVRQVVMLLKYNLLQQLLSAMDVPDALYTLEDSQGNVLDQAQIGQSSAETALYSYPLNNGYTLQVRINATGMGEEVDRAREVYFAAVIVGLLIVTFITIITCKFTKVPVNQLTDYIRKNYHSVSDTQGEGLTALRSVVDDILENHASAQYQLQELKEAQRWNDLSAMLSNRRNKDTGWHGQNYALMLFAPAVTDQEALLQVVRSVTDAEDEWALLSLPDGAALMLGRKRELINGEALSAFAEKLLSALDESGFASLKVAISACHRGLDHINTAYREASMARDCLFLQVDVPVLSYEDCDFQPGAFKTDVEYMSRQQHFNRLVSQGKYDQAAQYLTTLVPPVFMDAAMAHSEAGRMHLEMVKYQMMSCMDYLYKGTDEALEIRRDSIRELLMCTTYQQVLDIMQHMLQDMAVPDSEAAEKSGGDETLQKIKMYVRTHFNDPQLTITSLADQFGMSPNNVSKLFSRKAGVGVLQYIHKIRIENACNLMLNTTLNLTEISQQVGYTNTLTFSRAFKARYHMSPSEWRHMNEEK